MFKLYHRPFKDRLLQYRDVVEVYRNLNEDTLSIRIKGHVHGHAQLVALNDVTFHVGESGNKRVNEEMTKNVHAFVKGEIANAFETVGVESMYKYLEEGNYTRVYYNPYKVSTFVTYNDMQPIYEAKHCIVVMDRIYVK